MSNIQGLEDFSYPHMPPQVEAPLKQTIYVKNLEIKSEFELSKHEVE